MAVLRMQFSKLLFILFVIGFIANDVNGVMLVCPRPVFANPYAIMLDPDQQAYLMYSPVAFDCEEGHTQSGLPSGFIYCHYDGSWGLDISGGRCYAQCNTTKFISDNDVKVTNDGGEQQTVFDNGERANFECTNKSQLTGSDEGTCDNGTLKLEDEPSCLAHCPVNIEDLGVGLYYDIADAPVINETKTLYYRDRDKITYRCSDGYEGPKNRTPSDDGTSTCTDGSWDPPGIPTCMEPRKVGVGVMVPIISALIIPFMVLTCWLYQRLHRTSPSSAMSKMRTFPYDDDTGGSSDHEASRPGSMMIMNNVGTVQEVVLPLRNIPPEEESNLLPDNG